MVRVRLPAREVVLFTRQFQVLLGSGIAVHRALETLAEQAVAGDCAEVFFSLQRLVLEGRYLSAALSRFPSTFSPMYLGLVRVGEQTGALIECLRLLADWLERDLETRQKVRSALTYPVMVVVVSGVAVTALMNVLGPMFLQIFAEKGGPLPLPTRFVATLVQLQQQPWFWLLAVVGLLVLYRLSQSWMINPHWRVWLWNSACRVPALGAMLVSSSWSRYCAALSILTRCGVPPQRSYRFAAEVSGDPRLIVDCDLLLQSILQGEQASEHMEARSHLYPRLISSSLALAEDSGQGKSILDYLARFYRDDLDMRLGVFQALLEPILLLATSSVLLFLILSLMLPLYGKLQEVG